jgi:asparagine synthase (glutamine-hydrolysing)
MCGIAGLVGSVPEKKILHQMLHIMKHRGPDAQGVFFSDRVQLGHCRLAINDLSQEANQPFLSDDKGVILIVNGEIYNFAELRKNLESRGCIFKSRSDSEVVLHGYRQFGLKIIEMLNGMFAIAIFDTYTKDLILARDRLGIKPLYYSSTSSLFVFGSEIKALAQCQDVDLAIDQQSLHEYLVFENYFSNRTLNQSIKNVKPGEILIVNTFTLNVTTRSFWEPSFCDESRLSPDDLYDKYLDIAERSVKRHLLSDVAVGAYLSSGVDSSSVAYWATKNLGSKLLTYTGSFGMAGFYDEAEDAKKIADTLHCKNHNITITPDDFVNNIEDILWHLDEPRVGMGSFSQYMVAQKAAQDVKVILTGHGGDEFFAGYPVFKAILGRSYPLKLLRNSSVRELMFAAYFLFGPIFKKGIQHFLPAIYSPRAISHLIEDDTHSKSWSNGPYRELLKMREQTSDSYQRLFLTYLRYYLPALFVVEDKISMAHSLESRTPLCDDELLDFALSIPLQTKLTNFELKHIPRTAMKGCLPSLIYTLPKRGFPTPLAHWFKNELKTFIREFILDNVEFAPFLCKRETEKIIDNHCNQKLTTPLSEFSAHKVWILLNLVVYMRNQKRRYVV